MNNSEFEEDKASELPLNQKDLKEDISNFLNNQSQIVNKINYLKNRNQM